MDSSSYLRGIGLSVQTGPRHVQLQRRQVNGSVPPPPAPHAEQQNACIRATSSAAHKKIGGCGPCCLLGRGFAPKTVDRPGRAPWLQPNEGRSVGLQCSNSLTAERELFVPREGNKIKWYTCGPTVYDVAHMGHARAYLTFDILRRIMKDYFKYDVNYQINITDIDDKIILRSRQNKLFKDFTSEMEKTDLGSLEKAVDAAVDSAGKKLAAKKPPAPADGAPEKDKQEFERLTQEHMLKTKQHDELVSKVAAAKGSREALLAAARDPLMAKLDKERGHTISDHSIFNAHARHFEDEYFEDMDALGVLRPDVVTRISDFMDGRVQRFIEKLEDDGFCYASNGSVYFNIDAFNAQGYNYRKLVPAANTSAAEMAEGEGALADEAAEKKNPNDFAVWKASKPGEPAWESRWGPGRPGWHIECSVMATEVQGEFLDIHGGGEDLKFPHHDNEVAQSEAYLGRPQWTNYFWHAGHLSIEGLKMAKSLKNFITIRQALQVHSARQLRIMFLMQPWDKGMNYTDQAMDMAKVEERKYKHVFGCLKFFQRHRIWEDAKAGEREATLAAKVKETEDAVGAALRDNFNTSKVIEVLAGLRTLCVASFEALPAARLEPVEEALKSIESILDVLGVEGLGPKTSSPFQRPGGEQAWTQAIDAMAGFRETVRKIAKSKTYSSADVLKAVEEVSAAVGAAEQSETGDCAKAFKAFVEDVRRMAEGGEKPNAIMKRCDEVRDRDMVNLGVRLADRSTEGFIWMFDEREALEQEQKEAEQKAAAAARAKLVNKLGQLSKELKAAEKAAVKPADIFKTGAYSEFDENGVPTKLASGEELSSKKKKDCAKELAKQQKDYEALQKKAGDMGLDAYLAKLRSEVEDMERQVGPQ